MSRPPDGADWRTARTLRVRAELIGPVRLHRDWPAPLDGLLSSPRVIPRAPSHGLLAHPSLPIARTYQVSNWWWWASCCTPDPEPTWWTRRWDGPGRPEQTVLLPAGTSLDWWVIGEAGRLRELLGRIPMIGLGDRQSRPSWTVTDEGEPDYQLVLLTDDDTPGRPFPARYAAELGWAADVETIPGVSRPPYNPPTTATGDIAARHRAPVIAPWATASSQVPAQIAGTPPTL